LFELSCQLIVMKVAVTIVTVSWEGGVGSVTDDESVVTQIGELADELFPALS
jgi:hypothetical protein